MVQQSSGAVNFGSARRGRVVHGKSRRKNGGRSRGMARDWSVVMNLHLAHE